MKLHVAANKVQIFRLYFFPFLLASCRLLNPNQHVAIHAYQTYCGNWVYTSVTRNNTPLFSVTNSDTMKLNSDSTFLYDIQSVNKHMKGTWKLTETQLSKAIVLYYLPDSVSRSFTILHHTPDSLVFTENDVVFSFARKK